MTNPTVTNFVKKYYPFAKQTQDKVGISAVAILAQAAVESAWGKSAPGNMFFGVKDTDGVNGNEQLLQTVEYLATSKAKFPVTISVTWDKTKKLYKYIVKDYFRKYKTPEECFTDHAQFFFKNSRYAKALKVKEDPFLFIDAIAKAGYATAPDYAKILRNVALMIISAIRELKV
ncbi:glycoside hydrolase family 73 protein [Xanthocytophaga agilis]|uniref:Glucosaminidase domain-containing protein n=1 Tax=Xanthocytophaga agilis TaxID=3048010 RepID=A0AAE3QYN6_9BACT|nr:glucosaminidase domain-containing protein [Xanthocytophaga agilis]MDJ1500451.1 glucosaminidase domain-containing protein [Xanthocytophaga agilis]